MKQILNRILDKIYFAILSCKIRTLSPDLESAFNQPSSNEDDDLKEKYDHYIRLVSTADMAASFECVRLLVRVCQWGSFKKLLDFGSGISSVAFREYAGTNADVQVWSVEDDREWLKKTRDFLKTNNLNTDNLIMLDCFLSSMETDFDVVFLDLNFVDVRKNFIRLSVERCKPGGIIVFDDTHKMEFLHQILIQSRGLPIRLFSIKHLTLDRFGRFALLAIKDSA